MILIGLKGDRMKEVIQEALNQLEAGQPCVLATVVGTKGSTPQKSGSMLLVRQDGTGVGFGSEARTSAPIRSTLAAINR